MPASRPEGALFIGALFCLCLSWQTSAGNLCPASAITETAVVRSVTDGDTLRLQDGRKIRLIGINTPELAHDNRPAQPLAINAKTALGRLLAHSGNHIGLQYDRDRLDKYQRTLAHAYLPDGRSVQAALLEQGLATAYTTPPDVGLGECYRAVELQAMQQHIGLWSLADYQPKTLSQLNRHDEGFRRLRGKVTRISRGKEASWILLGEKIKIRIAGNDLIYFNQPWLQNLAGKQIEIRGWLHPEAHQYFMQLRHPDAVLILDTAVPAAK